MATRSHRVMIKQCNETSYTRTVVWTIISSLLPIYNTLLTHTTSKTAVNVMTATFNSKHDNTNNHTALPSTPKITITENILFTVDLSTKRHYLFAPTNAHICTKILNYMTNAPTCFRALHQLQGALILRLLKL